MWKTGADLGGRGGGSFATNVELIFLAPNGPFWWRLANLKYPEIPKVAWKCVLEQARDFLRFDLFFGIYVEICGTRSIRH